MCLNTLTSTKDIAIDNRRTCSCFCCWHTISESYCHRRILFHATNLTAAIDVTSALHEFIVRIKSSHRTVSDDDIRIAILIIRFIIIISIYPCAIRSYHGFLTRKCVISTLTTSEDITSDSNTFEACGTRMIHNRIVILSSRIVSIKYFSSLVGTDVHKGITSHICQFTSTIHITCNMGTLNILLYVTDFYSLLKHLTRIKYYHLSILVENFTFRITRHNIYLICCTNVYGGITFHLTLITTTKDIAYGANLVIDITSYETTTNGFFITNVWYILIQYRNGYIFTCHDSFPHVDIHLTVCICLCVETSTIDIVYSGGRFDIHCDISFYIILGQIITIPVYTRIRGIITTTYQILDDNRVVAVLFCLFDINGDVAIDTSLCVVATIYISENSTGNGQCHTACHISIIRTTMNIFYFIVCTTR